MKCAISICGRKLLSSSPGDHEGCFFVIRFQSGREKVPRRTDQPGAAIIDETTLTRHFLFRGLGPEVHKQLRSYAKLRAVASGKTIFSKGDPGTSLFAVYSGVVQMTSLSADGRNAV